MDSLDRLFAVWAISIQVIMLLHFAVRKIFFEAYTLRYGWLVYALCIPSAIISLLILRAGDKHWSLWLGGFLFCLFAAFGFTVDYVLGIPFRETMRASILIPYVVLYLATMMFYWWPLALFGRPLWILAGVLFVIGSVLNAISH